MQKVKFGEVIRRANSIVDKDNTDLKYYVGGEHFDSGEIFLKRKGTIEGSTIGPMFYFGFKKGQALVVSRNPHLRKASVVDFDGICSEKTFVLETIDSKILLQEYLPFIIQSDAFWQYAEENKSGSVNYFVNWSTFANYEFELPDLDKQRELAELLWAAEETKQAYKILLDKSKELVQAQFIQMFIKADIKNQVPLGDLCKCMTSKISNKNILNKNGDYPVFGASGFIQNIDTYDLDQEYVGIIKDGAGVGRAYALPAYSSVMNTMQYLVPNKTIKTEFLLHLINYLKLGEGFKGATIPHIYFKDYSKIIVPYPDEFQQKAFKNFVISENNSQKTLEDTLEIIDKIIKNMINQNLTTEVSHV